MGLERQCTVRLDDRVSEGKAHCGDGVLEFRGEFRLSWKWIDLKVLPSENGTLRVTRAGQVAEFELGEHKAKWEHSILHPKTWVEKIGLKPGHTFAVRGDFEENLLSDLQTDHGLPSENLPVDVLFLRMRSSDDLSILDSARADLNPGGAVWTVYAKGQKNFGESDVRDYARASGWIDVKAASINPTLTSIKFVSRKT